MNIDEDTTEINNYPEFFNQLKENKPLSEMKWEIDFNVDDDECKLTLFGDELLSEDLKFLCEALQHNTTIQSLNTSYMFLPQHGIKTLADMLMINSTISSLNIHNADLDCSEFFDLLPMLNVNSTLTHLDLSLNNLTDDFILAFIKQQKLTPSLKSINLSNNQMTNIGAIAIVDMLQSNSNLENLNISGNPIEDDGLIAFARLLATNITLLNLEISSITKFNLNGFSIKEPTYVIQVFRDALLNNKTLQSLSIDVYIDKMIPFVIDIILNNSTILKLYLNYCLELDSTIRSFLSTNSVIDLVKALQYNTSITHFDVYIDLLNYNRDENIAIFNEEIAKHLENNYTLIDFEVGDERIANRPKISSILQRNLEIADKKKCTLFDLLYDVCIDD